MKPIIEDQKTTLKQRDQSQTSNPHLASSITTEKCKNWTFKELETPHIK